MSSVIEVETPHGPAHAHLHPAGAPRAALVLGHGAGGGVSGSRDLVRGDRGGALAEASASRWSSSPTSSPAARAPAAANQLDAAWTAVGRPPARRRAEGPAADRRRPLARGARGLPHRRGDRRDRRAVPRLPGRTRPAAPRRRRLVGARRRDGPTLVVQGERDPFGMPPPGRQPRGGDGGGRPRPQEGSRCRRRRRARMARASAPAVSAAALRAALVELDHRQHVAGRILEPGDRRALAAHDAPLVLVEALVALELARRARSARRPPASMSSTGKLRIVYSAGVWSAAGRPASAGRRRCAASAGRSPRTTSSPSVSP